MPKNYPVAEKPMSLKFSGLFDFDGLYKVITDWFIEYGFYLEEPVYKHKVPTPAGAEQEIEWTGWKKINEYVRYWIDVYTHIYNLRDVEVVKEGVKKTLQRAEIIIEFDAHVETDYPGMINTKFGEYLRDFWDNYLLKKDMDVVWTDQLYYIMYKLHTAVKEFLGMETYPDPFKEVW